MRNEGRDVRCEGDVEERREWLNCYIMMLSSIDHHGKEGIISLSKWPVTKTPASVSVYNCVDICTIMGSVKFGRASSLFRLFKVQRTTSSLCSCWLNCIARSCSRHAPRWWWDEWKDPAGWPRFIWLTFFARAQWCNAATRSMMRWGNYGRGLLFSIRVMTPF